MSIVKRSPDQLPLFSRLFNGRIQEFDVCAALETLEHAGYPLANLSFLGTNHCQSSTHLCEGAHLYPEGTGALILNLGLLVPSSPLPNYFRQIIDSGEIHEEEFLDLIQFFNHFLIKNFIQMSWIEKYFFNNWPQINTLHLHTLGLDSISSLHLCFSLYFPELQVKINKQVKELKYRCASIQLGNCILGEKNALGGYILQRIKAYTIHLKAEEEQTDHDIFWPIEVRSRLKELIFPLLAKLRAYLTLYFSIEHYMRSAELSRRCFLGYSSLGDSDTTFTWLLYEGMADGRTYR